MTFITLNRPDIIRPVHTNGQKCETLHIKQIPVTINPKKIVSMIEHFDDDGKFINTCISMEGSLYYNVSSHIKDIIDLIDYSYSTGNYVDISKEER